MLFLSPSLSISLSLNIYIWDFASYTVVHLHHCPSIYIHLMLSILLCIYSFSSKAFVAFNFLSYVLANIEHLIMPILQESKRSLSGERGYGHFKNLQKKLRMRQQYMISQVSLLYPVKISAGPSEEQELDSFPSTSKSGDMIVSFLALRSNYELHCSSLVISRVTLCLGTFNNGLS